MNLERFTKNKNQKRIVVGSIVGILLLIGSIVLIRSYALYEEEKEFNVLKGQIPDFGYDIKMLSVVVDGEKSKTIPTRGLYKTEVECSGGTTGSWDYNAWNLVLEDVESNSKCNLTFTSNLSEEEYNKYIEAGKALRRNTYRGKDITSYHNNGSLYEMISSGRFDDIYVGDYINTNNVTWLVADMDNYLYSGYKEGASDEGSMNKHHLTIIPANYITTAAMNSTNTTEGGYVNSAMKKSTLPNVLNTYVKPTFGSHILTYNTMLTNSVNATAPSNSGSGWQGSSNGWGWYESQIDLMSEKNVYGADAFSSSAYDTGIDNRQYAIFQLKPEFINTNGKGSRFSYWLKNVSSSTGFTGVSYGGISSSTNASSSGGGVRPRFLIGELINLNGKGGRFSYWLKNVSSSADFAFVNNFGNSSSASASNSSIGVHPRFLIG